MRAGRFLYIGEGAQGRKGWLKMSFPSTNGVTWAVEGATVFAAAHNGGNGRFQHGAASALAKPQSITSLVDRYETSI